MNLAPPNTRSQKYHKKLLIGATEVCEASLRNAAMEAIDENEGNKNIAAPFDESRQKRGHISLSEIVTVTYFDTDKVLDFELSLIHI